MPPRLKRAPPYEDDPECKYIVIDDPWPGNKVGKERDALYWNYLCAWVRFMFDKKHEPECVFSVNTRNEVIVQLPAEADIVPILGAHPWVKVLTRGDPRDRDRVSHVFEYDYRMKGEPGNHNWLANHATTTGDPPPHLRFPVKFPYPHVSWASPRGKSCANISLPLPPTRQPTPIPDTSGFTPYQRASQLTSSTISSAEARKEERRDRNPQSGGPSQSGKIDPYAKESNALRTVKQEETDVKPRIKRENGAHVKTEAVKSEPALYAPSKSFRSAVEQLQQSRASHDGRFATLPGEPSELGGVKPEEEPPRGPSDAFIAAFHNVRGDEEHEQRAPAPEPKMKDETQESSYQPSNAFIAAIQELRRPSSATDDDQTTSTPSAGVQVKQDPEARRSSTYSALLADSKVKREPEDERRQATGANPEAQAIFSLKRVKEEPHEGRCGKRIRQ
ncbi:hypothetical protein GSI_00531 [Ganoderma sinense ZZ0214-1]|uniref:Uncharacterized protein n=1 Tax=Ganoderma sinense ZZ0214-1 TaxID=1077348 RepID=A0A2G8SSS9_9APHY|nr:hypothetical protein GSI_00531 [Ganoderma sinense ZZ0214-1]